jgi:beta-phosphoglucomutase-like phosphatase (HAD superfamily)/tRNA(Arg) A34 adenosine deaminase TadA
MLGALIFDLDGTLVDTNELHTQSWVRGFARHGYKVDADRIRTEIGKGGDNLVPSVLGPAGEARDGEALREAVSEEYPKLVAERGVRLFDGVVELLAELKRRGIRTAIATSSAEDHLSATLERAGVDLREHVDAYVNKDDVENSKPDPDIVLAAVRVTSGGIFDAPRLIAGGARRVWRDPAQLLAELDDVLRTASPTAVRLDPATLERLMHEALAAAEEGLAAGEAPIGCAIADGRGRVLARGYNEMNRTQNKTAHAEIVTFARIAGQVPLDARDLILASTLEPCVMCTGASMEAAVDTIVYGLRAPADAGTGRVRPPESPESQMPRIVGDVCAAESRQLFERWLAANAGSPQAAYVEQLLGRVKEEEDAHGGRAAARAA